MSKKKEVTETRCKTKTDIHKKAFLVALEKSLGVVSTASKATGTARQTHYEWYSEDKDYAMQVDLLKDLAIDFAESRLLSNINKGSDTAIIFYLKTQGKKRGYVERTEMDFGNIKIIQVNAPE